jgi:hypothetical protein
MVYLLSQFSPNTVVMQQRISRCYP